MAEETALTPTPAPAPEHGIKKILTEFKTFIARGNVLDLAVGVIVGGAFTSIVHSLVDDILMPIIGTLLFGINFNALGFSIPWGKHPYINVGGFVQAVIVFLITAACVFLVVKAVNAVSFKKKAAPAAPPKPTKEELLLTEIRDLLKEQANK